MGNSISSSAPTQRRRSGNGCLPRQCRSRPPQRAESKPPSAGRPQRCTSFPSGISSDRNPPVTPVRQTISTSLIVNGRGGRIRTDGLLVPNQALYQAKLHPAGDRSEGTRGRVRTEPQCGAWDRPMQREFANNGNARAASMKEDTGGRGKAEPCALGRLNERGHRRKREAGAMCARTTQ